MSITIRAVEVVLDLMVLALLLGRPSLGADTTFMLKVVHDIHMLPPRVLRGEVEATRVAFEAWTPVAC